MAEHTITLSDSQEATLAWWIDREYERITGGFRRNQPLPAKPTIGEFLENDLIGGFIAAKESAHTEDEIGRQRPVVELLVRADPETRRRVCELLGLEAPPAEAGAEKAGGT